MSVPPVPAPVIASLLSAGVTGTLGIFGTLLAQRWREHRELEQTGELETVKRLQSQIQQERKDCVATQRYLRAQIVTWQSDAQSAWAAVQRLLNAADKLDPVNAAELLIGQRVHAPPDEEAD